MAAYRIQDLGSRIVVGTEQESILICKSVEVAKRVVADATLLETCSATQIFTRKPVCEDDE